MGNVVQLGCGMGRCACTLLILRYKLRLRTTHLLNHPVKGKAWCNCFSWQDRAAVLLRWRGVLSLHQLAYCAASEKDAPNHALWSRLWRLGPNIKDGRKVVYWDPILGPTRVLVDRSSYAEALLPLWMLLEAKKSVR